MPIRPPLRGLLAALFVLGMTVGFTAVANNPPLAESGPKPALGQVGDDSLELRLRLAHGRYDPARSRPPLPPNLRSGTRQSDGPDYYLVQFHGPIRQSWRDRLEASGAIVMDYVPDFAYIVRMDRDTVRNMSLVDGVRWMGIYEAGFRLSPELILMSRFSNQQVGTVDLVVRAFRDEPAHEVVDRLTKAGAVVMGQSADSGGGAIFRVVASLDQLQDLAAINAIAWIERELEPAFSNSIARSDMILNQDRIESELGLFGGGQIVAVGDSGLDTGNPATVHADFDGRVIGGTWGPGSCGTWADGNSHGTHVAGSVAGSGALSGADIPGQDYSGSHAGIAPEAGLYIWNFCNNFSGLPASPYNDYYGAKYAVDAQLRISNNSWGYTTGQGGYNTFTRETDRFVADHPDMVLVYAAGNDGVDGNADGVVDEGSVNMPSTAKNVITVGASENIRLSGGLNPGGACSTWGTCWPAKYPANPINSDRISDDMNGMAAFSGRGPTGAGRIKPDVVAPGTNIVSTRNYSTGTGWGVYNGDYIYMGGTSMASPLVAGASAIVREFYDKVHGLANPGAALVKATLINGAADMTPGQYGTGDFDEILRRPDFSQGFGRVDLPESLIFDGERTLYFHEHSGLATGDTFQTTFSVAAGGAPLRATLVWTDSPGTEVSLGALVNDLDLEIETPGGVLHHGNETHTGGTADRDNNVEILDLPGQNGEYTLTVRGHNVPSGPQSFALVVSYQELGGSLGTLQGMVQSAGMPVEGAAISASGPSSDSTTSTLSGSYSLMLEEGSYAITVSRFGYVSKTVDPVLIVEGEVETLDIDLEPASLVMLEGTVTDAETGWALYARIDIDGDPNAPYWTHPASGAYAFTIPSDQSYSLTATSMVNGYQPEITTVGPLTSNEVLNLELSVDAELCEAPGYSQEEVLFDDFESGLGNWNVDGLWNLQTETDDCGSQVAQFPSPQNAMYYGQPASCNYETGDAHQGSLTLAAPISIPDSAATLSFSSHETAETDPDFDQRLIEVSNNDSDWSYLGQGNQLGGWHQRSLSLSSYAGQAVQFRFRFDSVDNLDNDYLGWFLDDVQVNGGCNAPSGGLIVGNVSDAESNPIVAANLDHEAGPSAESTDIAGPYGQGFYAVYSPAGTWAVEASATGYVTSVVSVEVESGQTVQQDFILDEPPPPQLTTYCTTLDLAIPDNDPAGVDIFLTVPDDDALTVLSAYVRGSHSWVGDLRLELTPPGGAPTVVMIDRPGFPASTWGCNSSNFDLWLDDSGADGPVENQCFSPPALRGRATPNEALAAFNGLNAQGQWTLNISDNAAGDTGTLNEWCLEIGLPRYHVGGTVSGLSGSGLVLQNNGAEDLVIEDNGPFEFPAALASGQAYDVTVLAQPSAIKQTCNVSGGTGTISGEDVTSVEVSCVTDQFTISGSVTGLLGSGLVLLGPEDEELAINSDGAFTFSTSLDDGSTYAVSVLNQPSDPVQNCLVFNGNGDLDGANVADIEVDCREDALFHNRFETPAP